MIAEYLSKQQALNADIKAIQQINFIENLDRDVKKTNAFHCLRNKKLILDFS